MMKSGNELNYLYGWLTEFCYSINFVYHSKFPNSAENFVFPAVSLKIFGFRLRMKTWTQSTMTESEVGNIDTGRIACMKLRAEIYTGHGE